MSRRWPRPLRETKIGQLRDNALPANGDVAERLQQLGCDPIEGMATLANDQTVPVELRARMYSELAKYIAPRRKAIDLSGTDSSPTDVTWLQELDCLSDGDLQTLVDIFDKAERAKVDGKT